MNDFEQELRAALERRDPPPGFAARVLARTETRRPRRTRWWLAPAAAAAALVLTVGTVRYQEYRKGVEAKQQVMLALEITAEKFALAERKLQEMNHHE